MLSIGIGSRTSTGGAVIEGNPGVIFDGLVASSVGHKASCPACQKGIGEIVAVGDRTVMLPAGPAARAGDYVACGCRPGSNILIEQGTVDIGTTGSGVTSSMSTRAVFNKPGFDASREGASNRLFTDNLQGLMDDQVAAGGGSNTDVAERVSEAGHASPDSANTWDTVTDARIAQLDSLVQGPAVAFINEVESSLGIQLRVTQGLRTSAEQDALYAQGRSAPGKVVTNAKGGESYHNYGLAIDVVEIKESKAVWNTAWEAISEVGIKNGFTWGGDWKTPDRPHFQMSFGLSINQLQEGSRP